MPGVGAHRAVRALEVLELPGTAVSGDIGALGALDALRVLNVSSTSVEGDAGTLGALVALRELRVGPAYGAGDSPSGEPQRCADLRAGPRGASRTSSACLGPVGLNKQ